MRDRAIRLSGKLRRSIEAIEAALAAGDLDAARRATARHHRILNRAAAMAAESLGEPDVTALSGGGSKEEEPEEEPY